MYVNLWDVGFFLIFHNEHRNVLGEVIVEIISIKSIKCKIIKNTEDNNTAAGFADKF